MVSGAALGFQPLCPIRNSNRIYLRTVGISMVRIFPLNISLDDRLLGIFELRSVAGNVESFSAIELANPANFLDGAGNCPVRFPRGLYSGRSALFYLSADRSVTFLYRCALHIGNKVRLSRGNGIDGID